jgi:hypothetical protein
MTVSLWIRETVGGKRTYRKPNKKKLYPNGTVFCLRYSINGKRRWETLDVTNLNAALAEQPRKQHYCQQFLPPHPPPRSGSTWTTRWLPT